MKWHLVYIEGYESPCHEVFSTKEELEKRFLDINWSDPGTYFMTIVYGEEFKMVPFEKVKSFKVEKL